MSTILITGVAGFVGSNLANKLIESGHKVIGFDNLSYGNMENMHAFLENENFSFLKKDVSENNVFDNTEADYIVHLASQKIPRYDNSYKTLTENDLMSSNVINFALEKDIKLVFASTSDVYGKNPEIPFKESSNLLLGPTYVKRWAYAVSKIFSEHKIIANSEENGLKYTIMRFFGSYGPNQNTTWWGGPQSVFIEKSFKQEEIELHGDGLQTRTFTFIEDTVQGIIKCIFENKALNNVYNIAGNPDTEISIKDLAHFIWNKINPNTKPKIKYIPYETFGKYEDVRRRVPNIDKISYELGYAPKWDLNKGLEKTIEWQKQK